MKTIQTIDGHRICTRCRAEKPFDKFSRCSGFKFGIRPDCLDCEKIRKDKNRKSFPEKYRQWRRDHYARNRERIIKETTAYAKAHPEMRRKVTLKHAYGISVEDYKNLEVSQGGKCAICLESPKKHVLFVDHCHETNKIRGLLCRKCNSLLGFCNDKIHILEASIKYIKEKI